MVKQTKPLFEQLTRTALGAARHPVRSTMQVLDGARVVATTGAGVATSTLRSVIGSRPDHAPSDGSEESAATETVAKGAPAKKAPAEKAPAKKAGAKKTPAKKAPAKKTAAKKTAAKKAPAKKTAAPTPADMPEHEPPHPVEAAPDEGGGEPMVTEPKASRGSAHGGSADPEEIRDWADERADGPDVETPVGTTGAGTGDNPDTAESDLQQPGTEPLMDPATTKAVASESQTLRKAAEKDPED